MRTMVLGVGAQKAGTTWLYNQLMRKQGFQAPPAKEIHYWDSLFLPSCRDMQTNMQTLPDTLRTTLVTHDEAQIMRRNDPKHFGQYIDFFDGLLNGSAQTSCDMTPSYAGLSADVFQTIRTGFEQRGITIKVVFIMREPIARIESALKMNLAFQGKLHNMNNEEMMALLRNSVGSVGDQMRASYWKTVEHLQSAFQDHQIFLGLYETLFESGEIDRLARFLDMEATAFDVQDIKNPSNIRFQYPRTFIEEMQARHARNYTFVQDVLGLSLTPWSNSLDHLIAKES